MPGHKAIIGTASTLALLLAWEAVSRGGLVSERFLPAPSTVLATLWTMIFERDLLYHAGVSTLRVWAAFLIAAAMAVPIGITMGSFRWVGAMLEPIVDFIRYLPVPALVPLSIIWFGVGVVGQVLFMSRFIVQIWRSEQQKRSVLPIEFWYFSIAGGLVTLSYAIYRRDLVFTVAQMLGLVIYFRNLYLVLKEQRNSTP